MGLFESIMLALGGTGALLLAIAFLARSLLSTLLSKDLEKFKAQLASAASAESQRRSHELEMFALEHQVRFSKLHERRAMVISALYSRLVEFQWAAQSLVAVAEFGGEPSKAEKYVRALTKSTLFFRAFDKNRIFLPESVCEQIEAFQLGMRTRVITFGVYNDVNEHAPDHVHREKIEKWIAASDYFDSEVPKARRALEGTLRSLLGDADPRDDSNTS